MNKKLNKKKHPAIAAREESESVLTKKELPTMLPRNDLFNKAKDPLL